MSASPPSRTLVLTEPLASFEHVHVPRDVYHLVASGIGLTSLVGFPTWVLEADVSHNQLTTLAGLDPACPRLARCQL
jgi:hypothetical protein